jgi:membrane protease YdiL (CAAX protease family)
VKDEELKFLVFATLLTPPGIVIFGRMLARIREHGGRVITEKFGIPDLFMAFFLAAFFALGALAPSPKVPPIPDSLPAPAATALKAEDVLSNAAGSVLILSIVIGFLAVRRLPVADLFGLRKFGLLKAGITGALLVAAIFPLLLLVTLLMQVVMREQAKEQEVVQFFRDAAGTNQLPGVTAMLFMAVLVAPIVEESIFRGYLYGVFKSWAGPIPSLIFTAGLFAAVHANIAVLPALLILSVGLTIAYEWSGSILVPIAMHAAFNGTQLILLLGSPHLRPPS